MSLSKRFPPTQLVNGDVLTLYHNPSHYLQALEFKPEIGDVILVTFARSGSHLVQQLTQLIVSGGQSPTTLEEFTRRAPILEVQGLQHLRDKETPKLLRTHLPMNRLRLSEKAKYIYVARNPWDCCVSVFHFLQDFPGFNFADACFDDFVDMFLEGQYGFGDYFDHIISGFEHRLDSNVFFVTYEDINRNKADFVLRLADFLGEGYGDIVRGNGDVLQQILERSSIDFMRNVFQTDQSRLSKFFRRSDVPNNSGNEKQSATPTAKFNLVRKGAVFKGSSYFSAENVKKMQNKIDEKFRDTDIMNLWNREEVAERV